MLLLTPAMLLGLALAAPATGSEMVRAQDPQSVVKAMQTAGYVAELTSDKSGDPMIRSAMSGVKFQIFFYNCTNNQNCATVQFHVGYDMKDGSTLDSMNEWNRGQRFGRAYLDKESDPILEMDVDLDDGGLAPLLFVDNLEFWGSAMGKFEKHIGFRN